MDREPIYIKKGTDPEVDSYSAFFDNYGVGEGSTGLDKILRSKKVTRTWVVGLAFDYCVGSTALHGIDLDLLTFVVKDAAKAVAEDTEKAMASRLMESGVILVNKEHAIKDLKDFNSAASLQATALILTIILTALQRG